MRGVSLGAAHEHRDAGYTVKCRKWKAEHKVVPGVTWGDLPHPLQEEWKSINCDEYLVEVKPIVPSFDCTASDGELLQAHVQGQSSQGLCGSKAAVACLPQAIPTLTSTRFLMSCSGQREPSAGGYYGCGHHTQRQEH
jgi:hypothetical protein